MIQDSNTNCRNCFQEQPVSCPTVHRTISLADSVTRPFIVSGYIRRYSTYAVKYYRIVSNEMDQQLGHLCEKFHASGPPVNVYRVHTYIFRSYANFTHFISINSDRRVSVGRETITKSGTAVDFTSQLLFTTLTFQTEYEFM